TDGKGPCCRRGWNVKIRRVEFFNKVDIMELRGVKGFSWNKKSGASLEKPQFFFFLIVFGKQVVSERLFVPFLLTVKLVLCTGVDQLIFFKRWQNRKG